MLMVEHELDFEDFKQTVMFYGILNEDDYRLATMIENADEDLHNFFSKKFVS